MKPPCSEKCRQKCSQKFTEEERYEMWSQFRNLKKQSQRNFISKNVRRNRKKVITVQNSQRLNTLTWNLGNTKVCKTFFLNTLGFFNDQTVVTVLKANFKNGIINVDIQDAAPEQRGKSNPWNKFSRDYNKEIKDFIEKTKPIVSHYNLKHAPNRRYLPCGVSFTDVYKLFKEHCNEIGMRECSWPYFHRILKDMNLSTSNPVQDLCTLCQNHSEKHKDEGHDCSLCDCKFCKEYPVHIDNKTEVRKILDHDTQRSSDSIKIFTVDMQKAICMSKLTIKDYFFTQVSSF